MALEVSGPPEETQKIKSILFTLVLIWRKLRTKLRASMKEQQTLFPPNNAFKLPVASFGQRKAPTRPRKFKFNRQQSCRLHAQRWQTRLAKCPLTWQSATAGCICAIPIHGLWLLARPTAFARRIQSRCLSVARLDELTALKLDLISCCCVCVENAF